MSPREAWWLLDQKKPVKRYGSHLTEGDADALVKQLRQWRAEGKTSRKRRKAAH